jgi:thioredoxin
MSEHTIDLTSKSQLERLMREGGGSAIIDFWAPWCGPCKAMAPHFDAAAEQMADEPVTFYKLNTQDHPQLAQRFNVRSIPTLMLVHNGEVLDVIVGAQDANKLAKRAKWLLSKARGEGFLSRLFG